MFQFFSIDLSMGKQDLQACLPILAALFFFSAYWFIAHSVKIKNEFYDFYDSDQAAYRHILFTKLMGFVLMGIFPIMICLIFMDNYSLADYGLTCIAKTSL